MNAKPAVTFHYTDQTFPFPNRTRLKDFLNFLVLNEGKNLDAVNVVFCNDEYLIGLNQKYLAHDTYTDIITFELSAPGEPILSDIFISVERVRANAIDLGIPFQHEFHRVIFHGFLHLCGYKDKTKKHRLEMRQREDHYLQSYFVPRGTLNTF